MVPQSWILHCLKMYKISHEVINFIEQTMQTWRVELTAGGRSIAETKIQRGIFQGDAISPLLFIIAMMPLNHILRKCAAGYKFSRSQEKNPKTSPGDLRRLAVTQTPVKNHQLTLMWKTLIIIIIPNLGQTTRHSDNQQQQQQNWEPAE